jgi:3-oxoadipate enol-lactonase
MPQYRAIATPALVIAGDEDRVMAPKVQKKIASILPNSRFELIENAGHVVYLEQPDRVFDLGLGVMRGP